MRLVLGDCLEVLSVETDGFVDAVVTDPPYELGFMGKKWDASGIAYDVGLWKQVLRVLKPGGHLLSFGGSRTYHRMACAIEDAGFEVRDQMMWLYGSGFPKSHNLKDEWQGWGTALKPAHEPIVVARKPLSEKTVAANVLKWGTGALNIDGCRVKTENENTGRFPANIILDEEAGGQLDLLSGNRKSGSRKPGDYGAAGKGVYGGYGDRSAEEIKSSEGGASRFFYSSKVSRKERAGSDHPTMKPIALMRYLVRLVTPPGGTVLDPFMGSGTTGVAAREEGFGFIGIEREAEYMAIAKGRIG